MKDEALLAFIGFFQFIVEAELVPLGQDLWLTGRQVCAHRKICFRQIEGLFIIHAGFFSTIDSGSGPLKKLNSQANKS